MKGMFVRLRHPTAGGGPERVPSPALYQSCVDAYRARPSFRSEMCLFERSVVEFQEAKQRAGWESKAVEDFCREFRERGTGGGGGVGNGMGTRSPPWTDRSIAARRPTLSWSEK